jgi:cytochrome c oxidase subunit 2
MTEQRRVLLLTAGLAGLLAGCAPEAVTEQGEGVAGLYRLFSIVAAVIFVIVASLIAWSILRFRARPGDEGLPEQVHTNVKLEILWFAIPTLIVIGLFISSTGVLQDINKEAEEPAVEIDVTAFQWGWRFEYADIGTLDSLPDEPAELVLPVGEPITFHLTSRDVVHSFYIPRFLIKKDANPGRENQIDVTIEEPGTYGGVCAEFCGLLHSKMNFSVKAVSPDEFDEWVAGFEDGELGNGAP